MKKTLIAAASLCLCPAAFAASTSKDNFASGSHLDAYYSNMDLKLKADGNSDSIDGDGGGLGLWLGNGWGLFTAEFQTNSLEESGVDFDVRQVRVGMGGRFIDTPEQAFWIRAEYISFDADLEVDGVGGADDSQNGYGVHLGGRLGSGALNAYAEFGTVQLEDIDGLEYKIGANFQPGLIGGFIEYRFSDLETDKFDIDEQYKDIRVGIRVAFQ